VGAQLVHISTEAVFDGLSHAPYSEEDPCHPVSIYGSTKLAGEKLVQILNPSAFVLRTSWLYASSREANFPSRLLDQLTKGRQPVPVVTDIVGNPTPASLLAEAITRIICNPPEPGIYHVCCQGSASKFEWARQIAEANGFGKERIVETESRLYPSTAKRPQHVDLSCAKFLRTGLMNLPRWDAPEINAEEDSDIE
jgi:dTDP-4-dehydrorhamnose reductase